MITPVKTATCTRLLKQGDKGPDVTELQKRLNACGEKLVTDGNYSYEVANAVQRRQHRKGLAITGRADIKFQLTIVRETAAVNVENKVDEKPLEKRRRRDDSTASNE